MYEDANHKFPRPKMPNLQQIKKAKETYFKCLEEDAEKIASMTKALMEKHSITMQQAIFFVSIAGHYSRQAVIPCYDVPIYPLNPEEIPDYPPENL